MAGWYRKEWVPKTEEGRAQRDARRKRQIGKSAEGSEKRESSMIKASGPAAWSRKGSVPHKEEGRAQREVRRERQARWR